MAILGETGLRTDTITPGADFTMIVTRFAGTQLLTITGSPTGGTFTVAYKSASPVATLAYNASAATVQAALEALPNIGAGNVTVGLSGSVWTVTPQGNLKVTDFLQNLFVVNSSGLTGGTSPKVTASKPVLDVSSGYAYELQARKVAGSPTPDILVNTAGTGAQGTITLTDGANGHIQINITDTATGALDFTGGNPTNSAHWVLMETHGSDQTALVEDAIFTLRSKWFV